MEGFGNLKLRGFCSLGNTEQRAEATHSLAVDSGRAALSAGGLREGSIGSGETRFSRRRCVVISNSVFSLTVQKVLKDMVIIAELRPQASAAIQTVKFLPKLTHSVCSAVLPPGACLLERAPHRPHHAARPGHGAKVEFPDLGIHEPCAGRDGNEWSVNANHVLSSVSFSQQPYQAFLALAHGTRENRDCRGLRNWSRVTPVVSSKGQSQTLTPGLSRCGACAYNHWVPVPHHSR